MPGLLEPIDRWRAGVVDWASFGAVNLLQRRHPPPRDFRAQWNAYARRCDGLSVEEFYTIPDGYAWPAWPEDPHARWRFPTPDPGDIDGNNHAGFDLYPCADGWSRAPTMILAHGWMSVSDFGYKLWARRLNEVGWNAVFMHLPYHYSRRLPGHLHGEYAINAHLIRVAEGIRQAVLELKVLVGRLKERGCPLVGGWGTSYGGWIMGMAACVIPELQRLVLVEPILDVHDAIWNTPASVTIRRELRKLGIGPEDTQPQMRLCCPSHSRPHAAGGHILLIAGVWDRIASPEKIHALQQAWPGSHYAEYKQGHVGYTLMPQSFRRAQELWPEDFHGLETDEAAAAA
ncbi:MAG: hypothetical protein AAGK14_02405 [Verrucomicrobiota bacterium]